MVHLAHCALPILILAAGASRRMRGPDKLLERIDGEALLCRQVRVAKSTTRGPVLVTLPPKPHPRYEALAGQDVRIVPVPDAAEGMSASLRRGIAALPETAPAVMVLLADLPELTLQDLAQVCAHVQPGDTALIWRGATSDGAPGHPIVFRRSLFAELMALTGDTGGAEVVARHRDHVVLVPLPGDRARADLDTPEDWAAWRAAHPDTT